MPGDARPGRFVVVIVGPIMIAAGISHDYPGIERGVDCICRPSVPSVRLSLRNAERGTCRSRFHNIARRNVLVSMSKFVGDGTSVSDADHLAIYPDFVRDVGARAAVVLDTRARVVRRPVLVLVRGDWFVT